MRNGEIFIFIPKVLSSFLHMQPALKPFILEFSILCFIYDELSGGHLKLQ
jgi:hypothetical protein